MTDEPPPPPAPPPPEGPPPPASGTIIIDDDSLPVSSGSDAELREAVGAEPGLPPRLPEPHHDDRHDAPPPKRSRLVVLAGVLLIAALAVGACILLGSLNAGRYEIACAPDEIRAERGRAFPPWGERELTGAEWKAIAIPADAECKPQATESEDELAGWFLDLLVERAEKALAARDPTQAEVASVQLQQALLLARAPARRDQRREVERRLGDVEYWRAMGKLVAARALLADAAKQLDSAAAMEPRHVTDAAGWAAFVRATADELQSGPGGLRAAPLPLGGEAGMGAPGAPGSAATAGSAEHVPPGVALPIEPGDSSPAPPPAADAGVPTGGVLL